MSQSAVIVCKPTSWIKLRASLIILMFSVFAYLFYTDGSLGYREQNEQVLYNDLIVNEAAELALEIETEQDWKAFAATQEVGKGGEDFPLPADFDVTAAWPEELVNGFSELKRGSNGPQKVWEAYSGSRGWGVDVPDHPHDQADLNVQYGMCIGCAILALVVVFILLRILSRNMTVTTDAYFAPGGAEVPFTSMRRIDARKWDNKGVAHITYEEGGESKKAKVDGFLYGEFDKENDQSATKLYDYILQNFKGELIELETVDESDEEEAESPTAEA